MKKFYILTSSILVVIFTVISLLYLLFYHPVDNLEGESIDTLKINLENEKNYLNLEELPQDYTTQQAIDDKCFVAVVSEVYNKETLDEFIKNVNNKKEDILRIVQFTIEGDKVITDLEYLQDDTINMKVDSTRDKFSSEGDRKIVSKQYSMAEYQIIEDEYQNMKHLYLENKNGDFDSRIIICGYLFELSFHNSYELIYERRKDLGIDKVIETGTIEQYKYDIYSFGGNVKIKIGEEIISLKEALLQDKITMNDIIYKCIKDDIDGKVAVDMYKDGGTIIYKYDEYWIIKCYGLDGKRDVYIGMPNMQFTGNTVRLAN